MDSPYSSYGPYSRSVDAEGAKMMMEKDMGMMMDA